MKKNNENIAIIGCGNMGGGIARRLGKAHPVFLYDRNAKKMEILAQEGYGTPCRSLQEAFEHSEILILAIKPQGIQDFGKSIAGIPLKHTIISLLVGTAITQLRHYFPEQKIIRMMPNLALLCGEGAIGLCTEEALSPPELDKIDSLCEALGKSYWISESKFDGFSALAGSGIAFVFALIEAMVESGIAMGLSAEESQEMIQQTIKGGVQLLRETKKHPAELKWQVTSPGGTTIAGLQRFEEAAISGGIMNTFLATYQRSMEL